MIEQIRHLQSQRPFEPFAIELGNGRVIQIYDPWCVASVEGSGAPRNREGQVRILRGGAFELINAEQLKSTAS